MQTAKLSWTGGLRFEGESLFGHKIATDGDTPAGGGRSGYKPTELVLFGLAGCTGIDVVLILNKMRQELTGLEIEVKAHQPEEGYPRPFKRIEINYVFTGHNLDRNKVEQAIRLSEEKYCSVSQTLNGVANIINNFEVKEG